MVWNFILFVIVMGIVAWLISEYLDRFDDDDDWMWG